MGALKWLQILEKLVNAGIISIETYKALSKKAPSPSLELFNPLTEIRTEQFDNIYATKIVILDPTDYARKVELCFPTYDEFILTKNNVEKLSLPSIGGFYFNDNITINSPYIVSCFDQYFQNARFRNLDGAIYLFDDTNPLPVIENTPTDATYAGKIANLIALNRSTFKTWNPQMVK